MRFYLVTVESTQYVGDRWIVAPLAPIRSLKERGPSLLMPMSGEELELHLPDGPVISARIASFGIDMWRDSEGNLYTNTDPTDPSLTLTISCNSEVSEVPPGTEIWLKNARSADVSAQ